MFFSKYLENKTPSVRDVVYLTDNTYTKYQVQRMEQIILNAIAFDLRVPTIHSFCNYFAMVLKIPEQVTTIANVRGEKTCIHYIRYLKYIIVLSLYFIVHL